MRRWGLLLLAGSLGACATERYGFRPAAGVTTNEAGFPASRYGVPPEAPRGDVYVASFGTRQIETRAGGRADLIHVRVAVANQTGDRSWGVNPAEQLLVAGGKSEKPDFMEIDGRSDSSTSIEPGKRKVIDFYYRLPAGAADASHLAGFEFQWQVDAGGRLVAERTPFVREALGDYGGPTDGPSGGPSGSYASVGVVAPWWAFGYAPWWGLGWYGGWGYPYYGPYYGYGYGPYVGVGIGFRGGYRPHSYGGPRYGGGSFGGGRGARFAPSVRGRPGR